MAKENIIKQACAELGITQKELAQILGMGETTIYEWSRGLREPPLNIIKHLDLLKTEQEFNRVKSLVTEIVEIFTKKRQ